LREDKLNYIFFVLLDETGKKPKVVYTIINGHKIKVVEVAT